MATNERWTGWIGFAGLLLVIIAMIDFFEGLIAIIRDNYYVVHGNQLIVFDTTKWGWITLIWGIVLVIAGFGLWTGAGWARWFTIFVVGLNILGQLSWLGQSANPLWALVIITLNIIVLYALCARWKGYPDEVAA